MLNKSCEISTDPVDKLGIIDPSTGPDFWDQYLSKKKSGFSFDLPDSTVIGIPKKRRRMRRDSTQVVYYGVSSHDQWLIRFTQAQTLLMCLFNSIRTIGEVTQIFSYLDGCNEKAADLKIRSFLEWMRLGEKDFIVVVPQRSNISEYYDFDFSHFCISDKIAKRSSRLDNPISLMIMPTHRCQTDCIYCYACRRKIPHEEMLSIKRIHQVIDEAADLGVSMVNLDGGDMMCHKDIVEIVEHLSDKGIYISACTKGYISAETAQRLRKAGLTYIQVGLDAPTSEAADRLVGQQGFFHRMIETIYNLTEAGITTRTNSVLTRSTLDLLPALVDFLLKLPLNNIKICPAFRSLFRDCDDVIFSVEEKTYLKNTMKELVEKYHDQTINWECSDDVLDMTHSQRASKFNNRPLCSSARTQCIVTPDGKVVTCEQSPQTNEFVAGDLKVQTLKEVWDSKALKEWCYMTQSKFKGTPCYECEQFKVCVQDQGHCYLDALKAYGSVHAPSPYCPKASLPDKKWC